MLDIHILATLLLIGQFISVFFILLVLRRQWQLFKLFVDREVRGFRRVFFSLASVILLSNVAPVIINLMTIFGHTNRPAHLAPISVIYGLSVSISAALSAFTIWLLYLLASRESK